MGDHSPAVCKLLLLSHDEVLESWYKWLTTLAEVVLKGMSAGGHRPWASWSGQYVKGATVTILSCLYAWRVWLLITVWLAPNHTAW